MNEEMEFPYTIRWADADDWIPAMQMVWKTFMKFEAPDYTEEGVKNFYDFLTDGQLFRLFLEGRYRIAIAEIDGEIVGLGSLRNINFLSLLFVKEEYHMKGIGSKLLGFLEKYLVKELGQSVMTVRSSPFATGFYVSQGFIKTDEELQYSGIRVTPMEKKLLG